VYGVASPGVAARGGTLGQGVAEVAGALSDRREGASAGPVGRTPGTAGLGAEPRAWRTASARATARWGERAGRLAIPGDAFLLRGPVGAGKTVLASGLLRGLGVPGPHASPTFTLVRAYTSGRVPAVHIDLYRLGEGAAGEDLGWEDLLGGEAVTVVEWSEFLGPRRPVDGLEVLLTPEGPTVRRLEARPLGPRGAALLAALASGRGGGAGGTR
jgi:tRNA threonylcarbamoyladenosine biosynthesis protein TsaE